MAGLNDLWIGDRVKLKTSGRTGKFEGVNKEGKARISVDGKIILSDVSNLEILPEDEGVMFDIDLFLEEERVREQRAKPIVKVKVNHTLDLHIDKLAPEIVNDPPSRILEYQLAQSAQFISDAIRLNYPHITIIHGKGQGVLREAIAHQLKGYPQVRFTFSKNQDGAVEVLLI
jgi:dsDNA-specific endonuclease/ATPase MutS2